MRVIVCGGRDQVDYEFVRNVLDHLHKEFNFTHIIEGEARGTDKMPRRWAEERGIPFTPVQAEWNKYGYGAGPIRNRLMVEQGKPDMVIAFPGGKGTANMIKTAGRFNIKVLEVEK